MNLQQQIIEFEDFCSSFGYTQPPIHEIPNTMRKLVKVYEAAKKISLVADGITDNTSISELQQAIATVEKEHE